MRDPEREMDCTDVATVLSGLVDDELDAMVRHTAERHLVACDRCRTLVARAEQLDVRLRVSAARWGEADPLPGEMIATVLRRTVGDTRALRRARRQAFSGWLAAAAALGLAATAWFAQRGFSPRERGLVSQPSPVAPTVAPSTPSSGTPSVNTLVASRLAGQFPGQLPAQAPGEGEHDSTSPPRSGPSDAPQMTDGEDSMARFMHGPPIVLAAATTGGAVWPGDDDPGLPLADEIAEVSIGWDGEGTSLDDTDPTGALWPDAALREEDADALSAAAVLLRQLGEADRESFADAERVREIVAYDGLVARLGEAHDRLRGDDRTACWSAESVLLRLERGPLSHDDLRRMQEDVRQLELPARLERASRAVDLRPPA